jgi:hypothetical protein
LAPNPRRVLKKPHVCVVGNRRVGVLRTMVGTVQ